MQQQQIIQQEIQKNESLIYQLEKRNKELVIMLQTIEFIKQEQQRETPSPKED